MRFLPPKRWIFGLLACTLASAEAAERVGIVTLQEGPAAMVRGATRYALAEGVRFRPGDIIDVSDKGLTEIEFPDGAALAMGPGTRLLAVASSRGKSSAGDYYVMHGAVKLSRVKKGEHFRLVTPEFILQPVEGATVLVLSSADGSVFVEGGETRLDEPPAKGVAPVSLPLKSGQFYARKTGQRGVVGPRPTQAFIGDLPKIFLDPLPSRVSRYKDREIPPKRVEEVSYDDVQVWLQAPPDVRRPLMSRFRPRLSDPAFRAKLVANLKFHPEWDPILFPEKYKPKEPPAGAPGTPASAGPGGTR